MTQEPVVRRSVTVPAPVEKAFATFTERLGDFKPPEHNLLGAPIAKTVLEPRVGGDIYDEATDGSRCRWARVLAFDAPERIVFSWDISPRWSIEEDLANCSEVEVRFTDNGAGGTLVELEHRELERHGPYWPGVAEGVGGDQGWPLYLQRYSALLEG